MTQLKVNINGEILPANQPNIDLNNRSFRYGDGVFESIKVINGKATCLEQHLERLFKGMGILAIKKPTDFSFNFFDHRLRELIELNDINYGGRIRLTIFRGNGGYYSPNNQEPQYTIEAHHEDVNGFLLNDKGLVIDIYPEMKKQVNKLSVYKTSNGLLYIMAALYAQSRNLDDVLIQNDKMGIIESSNSNLFIVSNGVLYTPGLDSGCLGGTMRMQVINLALENNIQVYESNITPQNLLVADEVFLTNAIQGIKWASSYRTKRYMNSMSRKITELLNERHSSST